MIPRNNICRSDLRFRKNLCFKVLKIWEYSRDLKHYMESESTTTWINLVVNELIDTLTAIDNGSYWKVKENNSNNDHG